MSDIKELTPEERAKQEAEQAEERRRWHEGRIANQNRVRDTPPDEPKPGN